MKIGFSPSVYEHAAALIGHRPWDVSRDRDLLVAAHLAAYDRYHHAPVVVGMDIYNLEAEAYGCRVEEPEGNGIPAIVEPRFEFVQDIRLPPLDPARDGRLPLVIDAGRELRQRLPDADVRIPVSGPFSIATSLLGPNLFLDCALDPDAVARLLLDLVDGQLAFCRAVVAAGLEIALFESAAAPPLLSPAQFRTLELPALQQLIAGVHEATGRSLPCIIGGDTTAILDDILATGASFVICPAEADKYAFMDRLGDRPVTVRINLDPRLVSRGTPAELLAGVDEILALAAGRQNVLLGTGAVPYETPPENILRIAEYVG